MYFLNCLDGGSIPPESRSTNLVPPRGVDWIKTKTKTKYNKIKSMGIQLKKSSPSKKKQRPYYSLVIKYMIGDANGNTSEEMNVDPDDPDVERLCRLLNKLKPIKGTWGLVLDQETITKAHEEKQLSKKDYNFLMTVMFDAKSDDDSASKFEEIIKSGTEYSFLVFQNAKVLYHDENKAVHETEFI